VKLKLDENLGRRGTEVLQAEGHDVSTVAEQHLQATEDRDLIEHCRRERRCLVTLDLDFANPLVFLPSRFDEIAVLRLADRPLETDLDRSVRPLAVALRGDSIEGRLWIIEAGRVRVYQEESRA